MRRISKPKPFETNIAGHRWGLCSCGNGYCLIDGRRKTRGCESCREYDFGDYKKEIKRLSLLNRKLLPGFDRIDAGAGKIKQGWEIDHIVPYGIGWEARIPAHEMAHTDNLQIMWHTDNSCRTPHGKSGNRPEFWFSHITGKSWFFSVDETGHHAYGGLLELCLDYGISYVKAASALYKQDGLVMIVGKVRIHRSALIIRKAA